MTSFTGPGIHADVYRCARVAAMRGDEVHVYEKENRLRGQLDLADKSFGKQEIRTVEDYLSVQRPGIPPT